MLMHEISEIQNWKDRLITVSFETSPRGQGLDSIPYFNDNDLNLLVNFLERRSSSFLLIALYNMRDNLSSTVCFQGARGFPGTPGLPGFKGIRVSTYILFPQYLSLTSLQHTENPRESSEGEEFMNLFKVF